MAQAEWDLDSSKSFREQLTPHTVSG
jgi:hypothetical protein